MSIFDDDSPRNRMDEEFEEEEKLAVPLTVPQPGMGVEGHAMISSLADLRTFGVPNETGSQHVQRPVLTQRQMIKKATITYSFWKQFREDFVMVADDGQDSDSEYDPADDDIEESDWEDEQGEVAKDGEVAKEEGVAERVSSQDQMEIEDKNKTKRKNPQAKSRSATQNQKHKRLKRKLQFSEEQIMNQNSGEDEFVHGAEAATLQDESDNFDWNDATVDEFDNFFSQFPNLQETDEFVDKNEFPKQITPLQSLYYFLPETILQKFADQTNLYRDQQIESKFTSQERVLPRGLLAAIKINYTIFDVLRYIAVLITMGNLKIPSINACWSTDEYSEVGISKIWSRDKFKIFDTFFHLSDNKSAPPLKEEPLYKIQWLIDHINTLSCRAWKGNNSLTIDEHMEAFKGRSYLKVYNRDKPNKWGIKLYILADSAYGYTLKIIVCIGKKYCDVLKIKQPDKIIQSVVLQLLKGYEYKGSIVAMDNFYSSPDLFFQLTKLQFRAIGTCRADRLKLSAPQKAKIDPSELGYRDTASFIDQRRKLHLLAWHDRKVVKILTNFIGDEIQQSVFSHIDMEFVQNTPAVVSVYNAYTHGVDKRNQLIEYFKPEKRNKKWWKAIFSGLLQTIIVNAWKIFTIASGNMFDQRTFRRKLVVEIMDTLKNQDPNHKQYRIFKKGAPSQKDLYAYKEVYNHYIYNQGDKHNCMLIRRGKCADPKKTTVFICAGCPYGKNTYEGIHPNCFRIHMREILELAKQDFYQQKQFSRRNRKGPQATQDLMHTQKADDEASEREEDDNHDDD